MKKNLEKIRNILLITILIVIGIALFLGFTWVEIWIEAWMDQLLLSGIPQI